MHYTVMILTLIRGQKLKKTITKRRPVAFSSSFSTLAAHQNYLGGILKTLTPIPHACPQASDFIALGWDPGISIVVSSLGIFCVQPGLRVTIQGGRKASIF